MGVVLLDPSKMAHAASRIARTVSGLQETTAQLPSGMPMLMPPRVVVHTQSEVVTTMIGATRTALDDASLATQLWAGSMRIQGADGSFDLGTPATLAIAMWQSSYGLGKSFAEGTSKALGWGKAIAKLTHHEQLWKAIKGVKEPLGTALDFLDAAEAAGGALVSNQAWQWKIGDVVGYAAGSYGGLDDAFGKPVVFLGATAVGIWSFNTQYVAAMIVNDTDKQAQLDKAAIDGKFGIVTQVTTNVGDAITAVAGDAVLGGNDTSDLVKRMANGERGSVGRVMAAGTYAQQAIWELNPVNQGIAATRDLMSGGATHHHSDAIDRGHRAVNDVFNAAGPGAGDAAKFGFNQLVSLAGR